MKKKDNIQYVTFHMKPPKYMIGDVVYSHGFRCFVCGVYPYYGGYSYDLKTIEGEGLGKICQEDITECRLTPDILEKNGWNGDEIINIYIHKSFNIAGAFDRKGFHVVISDVNDDNKKANVGIFKYVHELQHLLFGLGLNSYIEVYV